MMTTRDNWASALRDPDLPEVEVRALLCRVVRTCRDVGVRRLRAVVLDEEPVFYISDPLQNLLSS